VRRGESGLLEYFYSVRFMRRLCKALLGKRLTDMLAQEDIESVWFLDHILHARASYVPKPFEGDVILFKSDDCPKGRLFDAHLGWGGLVKGRLQSYHVGGSHLAACVGPRAAVVAGHIESFLGTPGETEQRNG
jgi:thioesterase domain-containing protein